MTTARKNTFDTPLLLLVFNRPEATERVWQRVCQLKPATLFVAADGPRPGVPGEDERCRQVRQLCGTTPWNCSLQTRFLDANQGCKKAVSGAIDWFFDHETEGIILEDDCLPGPGFFTFCREMLKTYRHDKRVWHISGCNHFPAPDARDSYYFSNYPGIWGWATWKRAWEHYDRDLNLYPEARRRDLLKDIFPGRLERAYWRAVFDRLRKGKFDTWDYQWLFTLRINHALCIRPNVNLVQNTGIGSGATHTAGMTTRSKPADDVEMRDLTHPPAMTANTRKDREFFLKWILFNSVCGRLKKCIGKRPRNV